MDQMNSDHLIETVLRLRRAKHVVCFSGAGISAEGNIPTFRDDSGLWRAFPPEQFANWKGLAATAFKNPRRLIDFVLAVLEPIAKARPNAAHLAVARLEQFRKTTVITQNVDGLHKEAGNNRVLEIHGTFLEIADSKGKLIRTLDRSDLAAIVEGLKAAQGASMPLLSLPAALRPLFGRIPGFERPRIVLFGEALAEPDWTQANDCLTDCDMMLVIGTSGLVWPANTLPQKARAHGAYLIAIDPECQEDVDLWIPGKAGEILPQMVNAAFGTQAGSS
jgi:NAD-dependent deacetylase